MRNRELDHSSDERGRSAEAPVGSPLRSRQRSRRRHGPRHGGGEDEERSRGGNGRGRRRGRRGDVRLAILTLLQERPMHGYEMMQELAERTHGMWRVSPGSVYPALQLLEDQGLVRSETADGRRQFTLTDAGRAELASTAHAPSPWETKVHQMDEVDVTLRSGLHAVALAVHQVAEAGTAEQKARAEGLLKELRRQLYLILAGSLASHDEE